MKEALILGLSSIFLLFACGGDSASTNLAKGALSISLTDAPIDEAENVFVTIRGISLKYEDGPWAEHDIEGELEATDLLTLQEGNSVSLFNDTAIEPGSYQLRLNLSDEDMAHSLVIALGGEQHELTVPSGAESGLKFNSSILVPANGSADYTIDFDARQSIVLRGNQQNNNGYLLKPVLRLIDNANAASISGTFSDSSLFNTDCSDDDPLSHNLVYVFEGSDIIPDDYYSQADDNRIQAVTTAIVKFNEQSGEYQYTTAPLLAGEYTVSFTCNSDLENLDLDDDLRFKATGNKSLVID
jgi:hypothetical protein